MRGRGRLLKVDIDRITESTDAFHRTADAVAAELGVTRERARQIELHALRKLRATPTRPS